MVPVNNNYLQALSALKQRIRLSRQQAALSVNHELLNVYWEIGNTILQQQKEKGWGAKIIDRLSADLRLEFPEMKGFSIRNLKYMRAFAEAWPYFPFLLPPPNQLKQANRNNTSNFDTKPGTAQVFDSHYSIIVQQPVAQLPWAHHQVLLDKTPAGNIREFYLQQAVKNAWSRNIMEHQINSLLHLRQGNAITNFELTLPPAQSDLARESLKNPYLFDFLGIGKEMQEKELERALMVHIKRFLLELGRGFAYVGNQYNLTVEGDEYFLDLLFYNYHMHCFVVFELKAGDFKPEYTGKLNFYINTVDEQIKGKADAPTIGVLLCKTPNDTVIKYALKGINTPMGIAEYEFTNALPKQLKAEMPTVEELEAELEKETRVFESKTVNGER